MQQPGRSKRFSLEFLLVIFCICFVSPQIKAQYGVRAGISIANFYYPNQGPDPDISYDIDLRPYLGYDIAWVQLGKQKPIVGPYLSVYRLYPLAQRLILSAELAFTQKGVNFSQSTYEKIKYKVRITYLEIPVLLSYEFIQREKWILGIGGGLYGALSLAARKKVETHNTGMQTSQIENASRFISGLSVALNNKYKLQSHFIAVNLRVFWDLTDALEIPEDQIDIYHHIQDVRNAGFFLTLGYEF